MVATIEADPWIMTASVGDGRAIDRDEVRRAVALLFDPERPHELRALPFGRATLATAARISDALAWLEDHDDAVGLYWTLNPLSGRPTKAAKEGDIQARRWLLVDIDPKRPKDCSATEAEKEQARAVAAAVTEGLLSRGWPAPVLVDSGNGYHLLFRVDLPNDALAKQILKAALVALAKRYDTDGVTIDRAVHNASRISKLPGTWARKGEDTPERAHRLCRLLSAPDRPEIVSVDLLKQLGSAGPTEVAHSNGDATWSMRASAGNSDHAGYVRSALNAELVRVALAPAGGRNNTLNDAAFRLGTLVGAGVLDSRTAEEQLTLAALRAGLGEHETRATIRSGLEAGKAKPRTLPEPKRNGAVATTHSAVAALVAGDELPPDDDVVTVCLDDVIPRRIEWLMPGRIPLGKITLLAGMQKQGKSFVTMDLAARVSTGALIPAGNGECMPLGSVVLLSAEDDIEDTIAPRLLGAEADMAKVHALNTIRKPDGTFAPFTLEYIKHLERAVLRFRDTKLVIIDPVTQYVGSRIDDHKVTQLRALLGPLKEMAERLKIAVLVVTHFNKGTNPNAIQRVTGSGGYTQLARANWVLVRDPKDLKRRLFLDAGTNIAEDPAGLAFRIVDGRIEWEPEPVTENVNDVLQQEAKDHKENKDKTGRGKKAKDWLTDLFATVAELPSDEVVRRGEAAGHSRNALFEAKKGMSWLKARRVNGAWIWLRGTDETMEPLKPLNGCNARDDVPF